MNIDTTPMAPILGQFRLIGEGKDAVLWLGGEMQFPINQGPSVAYHAAVHIAEECGYLVTRKSLSHFSVTGGDILGYVVVDWCSPDPLELYKVEHWTAKEHWLK